MCGSWRVAEPVKTGNTLATTESVYKALCGGIGRKKEDQLYPLHPGQRCAGLAKHELVIDGTSVGEVNDCREHA